MMKDKRYLNTHHQIYRDLSEKIVIITGPRQAGKTTFSKMLSPDFDYLNYDFEEHRDAVHAKKWDRKKDLIIFDELHKMTGWKRWLKGIFDVEGIPPKLLVTGSALQSSYRKVGDSLAGRFFEYRLHPFDIKEAMALPEFNAQKNLPDVLLERLWEYGGFPEPFLNQKNYLRWHRGHLDIILRQDLLDLETVSNVKQIERLIDLLRARVGTPISYENLARDLQVHPQTVRRWIEILENLYVLFRVTPYSNKIARSILKSPKYYFYDFAHLKDPGAKLENLVACALLKECHRVEDFLGNTCRLHYLRTKDGKEIDFLITVDETPSFMIEVKTQDSQISPAFKTFQHLTASKLQLVRELSREYSSLDGIEVRKLSDWLSRFELKPGP